MTDYIHGTSLSYNDFLQAKAFEKSFNLTIEKQTLRQIASDQQLARDGAAILEANADRVIAASESVASRVVGAISDHAELTAKGFSIVSYQLKEVGNQLDKQTALFDWRFSEVVGHLGKVDTSLQELIGLARTPSQTWAYEQFSIAREAYDRGLVDEAMKYLDHAINGFGPNTGFPLEPRFHYLLGTIYLLKPEPELAEAAFLRAAQVSDKTDTEFLSRAHCAAGIAASARRDTARARKHFDTALQLDGRNAEACFQSGKLHAWEGNEEPAINDLCSAISIDRRFSLRAASDGNYQVNARIVQEASLRIRQRVFRAVTAATERSLALKQAVDTITKPVTALLPEPTALRVAESKLGELLSEVDDHLNTATLYGTTDAQLPATKLATTIRTLQQEGIRALEAVKSVHKDASSALQVQGNNAYAFKSQYYYKIPAHTKAWQSAETAAYRGIPIFWAAWILSTFIRDRSSEALYAVFLGWLPGVLVAIVTYPVAWMIVSARENSKKAAIEDDNARERQRADLAATEAQKQAAEFLKKAEQMGAAVAQLSKFAGETDPALQIIPIGLSERQFEQWVKM